MIKRFQTNQIMSSSFSDLPDEIVLQVINKLIDLKTLCHCKLVSTCFHLIILQIDTMISYIGVVFKPNDLSVGSKMLVKLPSYESFRRWLNQLPRLDVSSLYLSGLRPQVSMFMIVICSSGRLGWITTNSIHFNFSHRLQFMRLITERNMWS